MSTGEGENPRDGTPESGDKHGRGDRIGVGGGDDSVSRIQLAARWAETYASDGESLGAMLRRFRTAYDYLDAVIHGVEPPDMAEEVHPAAAPAARPSAPPPPPAWSNPEPAPPPWASPRAPEPEAPPHEPRPWG